MFGWAVVWKEKRRKETKQRHWPIKKRKQERKRTKHPVHSSQSVEEGGSVSSAFLCWDGHGQPGSSLHCSTFPYLSAHLTLWFLLFIPELDQKNQRWFHTFPPLQMSLHDSSVAHAGCVTPMYSPGMRIMDPRSPLGTDRCELTFPCSKVRGQLWAWGSQQCCEWADRIHSLNWSWLWAWAEKFGCFCTCLCENASSPPQLTWEWNQCGDLDVSAQEQPVCRLGWLRWFE